MSVSIEKAGGLAAAMKVHFKLRDKVDDTVAAVWKDGLDALGIDDDAVDGHWHQFRDRWNQGHKPALADFCRFVRGNRPAVTTPWRPTERRCGLCNDTACLSVLAPLHKYGQALAFAYDGFTPGVPWGQTPTYFVRLPCVCTAGQKRQQADGSDARWLEMRDAQITWAKTQKGGRGLPRSYWSSVRDWQVECGAAFWAATHPDCVQTGGIPDVPDDEIPF